MHVIQKKKKEYEMPVRVLRTKSLTITETVFFGLRFWSKLFLPAFYK